MLKLEPLSYILLETGSKTRNQLLDKVELSYRDVAEYFLGTGLLTGDECLKALQGIGFGRLAGNYLKPLQHRPSRRSSPL
jgi:hypothetical protein